ncbi:MAG: helix-hairpin-helix domain-containing protein [Planctomycetaceae bacterium]
MPSASPVAHGGQLPATTGADPAEAGGAAENSVTTALGLSRGDVRFAFVCGGAILLLLVAYWVQSAFFGARLVEIDRLPERAYQFRLDINSATWVEWMQLDGIGEALARRIVSDREQHGPFASIDDVSRVQGIGPKTLANIRPHLDCSDCPLPASPQ